MGVLGVVQGIERVTRKGTRAAAAFITHVIAKEGGRNNRTWRHTAPPGVDSAPMPSDYVFGVETDGGSGNARAVGYTDPLKADITNPGEIAIYGRDASTRVLNGFLWFKDDGEFLLIAFEGGQTIQLEPDGATTVRNLNGILKILPDGTFDINGATIGPTGTIIDGGGTVLATHHHEGSPTAPDGAQSDTGSPV